MFDICCTANELIKFRKLNGDKRWIWFILDIKLIFVCGKTDDTTYYNKSFLSFILDCAANLSCTNESWFIWVIERNHSSNSQDNSSVRNIWLLTICNKYWFWCTSSSYQRVHELCVNANSLLFKWSKRHTHYCFQRNNFML